jgi:chaperonin GroEL (HSP60 family)
MAARQARQLSFGEEAREKIRGGVDTLAEAVKVTLGRRDRTVFGRRAGVDHRLPDRGR